MPHKQMQFSLMLMVLGQLVACDHTTSEVTKEIAHQFELSGGKSINLGQAVSGSWDKVCILGPYSNNQVAKETLGFEWGLEQKTSILTNEGISLLLFIRGNEVVEYVEHSRRNGDFTNLTRKCFPRDQAVFFHNPAPEKGWPGLFSKNET